VGFVIGTAGHVDHGKSALVAALTGIDPDRLVEEKRRGLTIDLGFANLKLPSGRQVGLIDVPGHVDFMHNLLSGMHGVDFALLVISVTEGVMPQTREHLQVLDLMGIANGLVVLTKVDLADRELVDLVSSDAIELLKPTQLAAVGVAQVSALSGLGLQSLKEQIDEGLLAMPPRSDKGRPRLPVDRAFAMKGFGTVVTGTLLDGSIGLGQVLELQPGRVRLRVRGLQQFNQPVERAEPGTRVAVNVAGIEKGAVRRGQVLTVPDSLTPTDRIDASVRVLAGGRNLRPGGEVLVHAGSACVLAGAFPLQTAMARPGESGWLQLRLRGEIAAVNGDHYVLTDPASGAVLGGGVLADVRPRRQPRGSERLIDSLVRRLAGDGPTQELERHPFGISRKELLKATGASDSDLDNLDARQVGSNLFNPGVWARLRASIVGQVENYHRTHPLRVGVPTQELRSRLHVPPSVYGPVLDELVAAGDVIEQAGLLRIPSHQVEVDAASAEALLEALSGPSPPLLSAALEACGLQSDVAEALMAQGSLVRIGQDLAMGRPRLDEAIALVRSEIERHGSISLSRLRDLSQGTRRTAQAILEHLDGLGETRRIGDQHVRGPARKVE